MQFASQHNLRNVPHDLARVRIRVRVSVSVRFRSEIFSVRIETVQINKSCATISLRICHNLL